MRRCRGLYSTGLTPNWLRPGDATVILAYRSGRLSIARDRFEVLGVRGDINKSTTFGTEDKCNPLEATSELRYEPCGAHCNRNRGGDSDLGMLRKEGSLWWRPFLSALRRH